MANKEIQNARKWTQGASKKCQNDDTWSQMSMGAYGLR